MGGTVNAFLNKDLDDTFPVLVEYPADSLGAIFVVFDGIANNVAAIIQTEGGYIEYPMHQLRPGDYKIQVLGRQGGGIISFSQDGNALTTVDMSGVTEDNVAFESAVFRYNDGQAKTFRVTLSSGTEARMSAINFVRQP